MAFFSKKETTSAKEKVKPPPPDLMRGHFLVTATSPINPEYSWQSLWMTGVLTGLGMNPTAIVYEGRAHSDKWPAVGQTLPVVIDRSAPKITEVLWAQVPDPKAAGLARAQKMVDAMTREASQKDAPLSEA